MPRRKLLASTARPARRRHAQLASADYGAPGEPSWRDVDWPSHLHSGEVAGQEIHWADMGPRDAPAVVFVHGLGGCWQNWLENVPAVARAHRAVALDLPGFGRSAAAAGEVTITYFAAVVEALCDRLGLGAVALVGNSMGGFTAAETAIRHPARVERLVLVDAAGITTSDLYGRPARALARGLSTLGTRAAERASAAPSGGPRSTRMRPGVLHAAFAAVMRHPTRISPALLAEQVDISIPKPGFVPSLDAILDYDYRDRLPEIACPTLVVQGADDMLVPLSDAYEYERLIPDARALVLEDTGHVPMMERPTVFNEHLLAFLDERGAERVAPPGTEQTAPAIVSSPAERG